MYIYIHIHIKHTSTSKLSRMETPIFDLGRPMAPMQAARPFAGMPLQVTSGRAVVRLGGFDGIGLGVRDLRFRVLSIQKSYTPAKPP